MYFIRLLQTTVHRLLSCTVCKWNAPVCLSQYLYIKFIYIKSSYLYIICLSFKTLPIYIRFCMTAICIKLYLFIHMYKILSSANLSTNCNLIMHTFVYIFLLINSLIILCVTIVILQRLPNWRDDHACFARSSLYLSDSVFVITHVEKWQCVRYHTMLFVYQILHLYYWFVV